MKKFIFLLMLFHACFCYAQHYRHIGTESGLSSRRVYAIQKDATGYMWFLTHEGIDRYDGKEFKKYTLSVDHTDLSSQQDPNWLYMGRDNRLWQISKNGRVFNYNSQVDKFELVYQTPTSDNNTPTPISYSFIDNDNTIWLCGEEMIYKFNPNNRQTTQLPNSLGGIITDAIPYKDNYYFIGTETEILFVELKDNQFNIHPMECLKAIFPIHINELYLDKASKQLFTGTFQRGVYVLDIEKKLCEKWEVGISDMTVNRIIPLNQDEILIATGGAGVYKVNKTTREAEPYIVADYRENNMMNGNNINDIFIDSTGRIWLANYSIGITVRDDRYSRYKLIKHYLGNPQSLVNDRVNAIIEDHEGDLWFATSNGVSLYYTQSNQWKSFLSSFNIKEYNNEYLSICEVSPGTIYVAGNSSKLLKIDKKTGSVAEVNYETYTKPNARPDKFIQSIYKDSQGYIWLGGYYNLKCIDENKKEIKLIPQLNSITTIRERDNDHIWIGTGKGLFLLNKTTGEAKPIELPTGSTYIDSLCQINHQLFIGTNGSGLFIYDLNAEIFSHYNKDNSALLSNNIYAIMTDMEKRIVFSSESGLTRYFPNDQSFHNWTKEQGLNTNHFNPNSGVVLKNGNFFFGSSDGAVVFEKDMDLPREYQSKMILSDFRLNYEPVYPGDQNSPLKQDINKTDVLRLNWNQNNFSIRISSINYDYPSNILYSWMLDGHSDWNNPGRRNSMNFTNVKPGEYKLNLRTVSNESKQILEERSMKVIVGKPFWLSLPAIILYFLLLAWAILGIARLIYLRKQRKQATDKINFFVSIAHDIRTPLTLIKAPLEEIQEHEMLSEEGNRNLVTVLRNVDTLTSMSNTIMDFERMHHHSLELHICECELNAFLNEIVKPFTNNKKVKVVYDSNFTYLNVWIDKEKMVSIFKNIISNAVKYTPEGGSVNIFASESGNTWEVEVKDTGIGIPANELKKISRSHFRASNAVNLKISGAGLGMMIVFKLVKRHKGKITLQSTVNKGTTVKVSFLKGNEKYHKAFIDTSEQQQIDPKLQIEATKLTPSYNTMTKRKQPKRGERILIVEDNDDLRNYLNNMLSKDYAVQTCENGKEALTIINQLMPDLIITDIMMPEMSGDELCQIIKNNIETSHIPIMMITALSEEKDVVKGKNMGVDEYIVKPFSVRIFKASISNLLTNRALLRKRFANLETDEAEEEEACLNCNTKVDWQFIANVRSHVDKNLDNHEYNIDLLAAGMNMSRTTLYNKIKQLTDLTPSDYIRNIRLNKAADLLKTGELNVTEVAEKTGFSDAKYFREVFKKQFNVSPSKYKEELHKEES